MFRKWYCRAECNVILPLKQNATHQKVVLLTLTASFSSDFNTTVENDQGQNESD
jgi:hypothetical protein